MLPQRTAGYKVIVKPIAEKRMALNQCPACGKPKDEWERRTDWTCCCPDCTEIYWKELVICYDWNSLRKKVFERDNHRCVECGSDGKDDTNNGYVEFIADHIKAISLGGDEWDINNIQILCKSCNRAKTKKDMGKIAIARRKDIHLQIGQRQLGVITQEELKPKDI